MRLLLKFIPINVIIDYLCSFLKTQLTDKTETKLDDNVPAIANKLLKMWASILYNPSQEIARTCLRETILTLIDFANTDVKKELLEKLQDK